MTTLSDEIDAVIAKHGGRVRDALNVTMAERDALRAELAAVRARWAAERDVMVRDWLSDVGTLTARAQTAEAQRDAYKRAKEENDERFMTERDAARAEAARLQAERQACQSAVEEADRLRFAAEAMAERWRRLAYDLSDAIGYALIYASGQTESILRRALGDDAATQYKAEREQAAADRAALERARALAEEWIAGDGETYGAKLLAQAGRRLEAALGGAR